MINHLSLIIRKQLYQMHSINQNRSMSSNLKLRLSSISEQSNDTESQLKTEVALLKVYYQLYAISFVELLEDPSEVFKKCSHNVQSQLTNPLLNFKAFNEEQNASTVSNQLNYLKKQTHGSKSSSKIIPKQQLLRKIKAKISGSVSESVELKQQRSAQTIEVLKSSKQNLDETADSKISVSEILDKLNDFDEERTQIKCQIYSEQDSKTEGLYLKWAELHKRMKEILQLYINKIGKGKSLIQIYNEIDHKKKERTIQGYSENQLVSKLDSYLQSLFLDEREILLHRSTSQKSKSVRSSSGALGYNRNVKKKLTYY